MVTCTNPNMNPRKLLSKPNKYFSNKCSNNIPYDLTDKPSLIVLLYTLIAGIIVANKEQNTIANIIFTSSYLIEYPSI